jgi:homoaconitase/3-isopropylmalate dehydratase large subunit
MPRTLFQKVWDLHTVRTLPNGQTQLYIGLHLVHEVTSPQAFAELRERGWPVRAPERTFATIDHIIPTKLQLRPFGDPMAEAQAKAKEFFEGWQRERADFANYKRRVDRDQQSLGQNIKGDVIKKYLSILDDLDRAMKNRPRPPEPRAGQ